MSEGPTRHCPGCGQTLRFPSHIGGMLMACPVCGHRFASPFKLAGASAAAAPLTAPPRLDPAPETVAKPVAQPALPDHTPVPPVPGDLKPVRQNTLAARVAAKYAAKSS
ncbi:hypothetical protein [Desulfovibrio sp. TomC]|uniref:hypothetical protein n=1 Tax=Desulfovibrio sp. TomC TaxID=1562888 RepID=UPI000574B412|nr:hypothetical protein [Desulfovibrio sp. TomC]KHK00729.1 hypothetical protein NY78_3868 [Desulfovibrio sp. TomC]